MLFIIVIPDKSSNPVLYKFKEIKVLFFVILLIVIEHLDENLDNRILN